MVQLDSPPANDSQTKSDALNETVKYLFERSLQLREYSQSLRERSSEINKRVRSCLNSKSDA